MTRTFSFATCMTFVAATLSGCGKPTYQPMEIILDEAPGITFQFSAADATHSSPVFMSIKGREPTPNDSAFRTRLIRRWVAAHAPEGAAMDSWGSAVCGLKRKGEFPGCDIFAIKVPSTGEKIEYYFYGGNWPFKE
jgi:hypothetical protein